ncbi:hypothetical protein [Aquisediminimonas sediminicola]|uniref:hypothetical protein n=1 Tax=Alteraquisediminimonas sediminicola TaxID=2676787 RepID=UPI001C8DC40A|nr:hypothetical protein [Aquisediminimonas sediminicola]
MISDVIGGRGRKSRSLPPVALICAWAVLLMLPEIIAGPIYVESGGYNLVWGEQIAALMRQGEFYPRWLPESWDGFGSPSFYFYAPLYFLTLGLVSLSGVKLVAALSITSLFFLGLSGLTMRAWLAGFASPRVALIGALAYMAAPYHLHDIYARAALAEASAFAMVPLVALAMRRVAARQSYGVSLLALGYALLLLAHLPVALLATVILIPAYAGFLLISEDAGRRGLAGRLLIGGVVGLGLSAVFLWPALALQPYISVDKLFGPFFQPQNWLFLTGRFGLFGAELFERTLGGAALAAGCAVVAVMAWRAAGDRKPVKFWAGYIFICVMLMTGLVPFFWELPGIRQVQFPWRIFPLVEFAMISLLVMTGLQFPRLVRFFAAQLLAIGMLFYLYMSGALVGQAFSNGAQMRAYYVHRKYDAPEYLPPGYPLGVDEYGRPASYMIDLPKMPLAVIGQGRVLEARDFPDGAMEVLVTAEAPTELVARRFFFPHWRLMELERTSAATSLTYHRGPQGLVRWQVPEGVHQYRLERGWAPFEQAGLVISAISCLLLLLVSRIDRAGKNRILHG